MQGGEKKGAVPDGPSARRLDRWSETIGRPRVFAWSREGEAPHPTFTTTAVAVLGLSALDDVATEDAFLAHVHPDDRIPFREVGERAAASGGPFRRVFRFVRPIDQKVIWLEDHGHASRDPDGVLRVVGGMCVDVTDHVDDSARLLLTAERERERAEEASRTKDEFLAVVSHELRTPLNAVLGWTTMLRTGSLDGASRKKALDIIERNARAQAQLIEDILDLSRIVTGKLRVRVEALDARDVVLAAVEAVRPAADAKGVALEIVTDDDVGPFAGDPDRLQQVVWNLVSNGVKFTPRGGLVRITLQRDGGDVVLRVDDSGQGIPTSFLPHVFERFRQADTGSTRAHGGLGLGLAIVRHIVELHGGTVSAESEGEGRGASFVVRLPERDAEPSEATPAIAPPASSSSIEVAISTTPDVAGISVLVVDDEADARDLLASVLGRAGARVITASNVEEGLRLVRAERPDVVVSDIGMPGHDGFELARRLRALPVTQGGRTPALALTAWARTEDRTQALLAGFTSHLAKPVETAELLAVIHAIVGHRARRSG